MRALSPHHNLKEANHVENRKRTNPLILFFAVVGVCAVIYGIWTILNQKLSEQRARTLFAAPASSGIPNVLHAPPSAPPQP